MLKTLCSSHALALNTKLCTVWLQQQFNINNLHYFLLLRENRRDCLRSFFDLLQARRHFWLMVLHMAARLPPIQVPRTRWWLEVMSLFKHLVIFSQAVMSMMETCTCKWKFLERNYTIRLNAYYVLFILPEMWGQTVYCIVRYIM